MSVKMALTKLCACAAGGALIGGGAVHVAESAQGARIFSSKVAERRITKRAITKRPVRPAVRYAKRKPVPQPRPAPAPTTVVVTTQGTPVPLPRG